MVRKVEKKRIFCINCKSENIIKRGKQKTKQREKQIYYCKDCGKRFVFSELKNKKYNPKIILNAISYYNLGYTLEQSNKLINKKFKTRISKSVIYDWVNEFKDTYPYYRIRDKILKEYGKDVLASKLFRHRGLTYNYKFHKAKLDLFGSKYKSLINYLKDLDKKFPHEIFERDERCSQIKISIDVLKKNKQNYACKLAEFALKAAKNNRERHDLVEEFMLVNDTATIASEVPVWFWEKKINNKKEGNKKRGMGICGHIDLLQIRFGKVYILDFKPESVKENEQSVITQLYLYALGLSFRTGINLHNFRCAWFDDNVYCEFNPAKVKVKW